MLPPRFAPWLFGLILSGLMSLLVSGITTWRHIGLAPGFATVWLASWATAWAMAFPVVLVLAPLTRRWVQRLVSSDSPNRV